MTAVRRNPALVSMVPALLVAVLALGAGAVSAFAPPATGEMAVIFAPGTTQAAAIGTVLAAGGRFANAGRFDNIVIALADDSQFEHRVREAGALLVLAATGLCGDRAAPNTEASS